MTIIARLTALLTANTTAFEGNLKRANSAMGRAKQSWNNDLNRAGRSFSTFDTHVRRSIGSIADLKTQVGGIAATVASALSAQKIIEYSDAWKNMEGQLRVATDSTEQMTVAQERLFEVAQRNSAPLKDVTNAYAKMSLALTDAQKKQFDLVDITELLSKTLLVSGTSAAGAATFFQQFGQAASSDFKAIGQEIQTFQDQNSFLVQVLKDNLDTGGQSLKNFAADGKLSFDNFAQALMAGSAQINAAAESIPVTVGRSLQRLDNAFLRFIGQSDAIQRGTSSIAVGINMLADNFDLLAQAALGLGAVFGARFVGAIFAATAAMVRATQVSYLYQLALARMAGISTAAATATLGLAGASAALGGSLALLGGPIGVALLALYAAWAIGATNAEKTQMRLNEQMQKSREAFSKYAFASNETKKQIIEDAKSRIAAYEAELKALLILADGYSKMGFLKASLMGIKDILSNVSFGLIDSPSKQLENIDKIRENITELQGMIRDVNSAGSTGVSGGGIGGNDDKAQKKIDDILRGLKEESEQLELQTRLYGQKESAIDAASRALKVQQQISAAGIKLTQDQQKEIDKYLASIERQTELQEVQTKQQEELEERERNRKQAIDQLGASFESAFEDAIVNGEKLGDVLDSLGNDILRLLTRLTITEPLINGISDAFKGSGGGGFLEGILGSFATGIDYVPHDMYAKIHRGERVVPAAENRGGMGGDVNVIIQNNNGSQVSQSARQTDNGVELTVMIDQAMADNIGRPGSRTNQALKAMQNRSLVRR